MYPARPNFKQGISRLLQVDNRKNVHLLLYDKNINKIE